MTLKIQRTTANGNPLMLPSGLLAGECCCSEDTTACSTYMDCTGHAGSPGVAPSMQVRLFDADYAGGDIVFCGKTWTNAEVQAGVTKCTCPDNYRLFNSPLLTNTVPQYGLSASNKESWVKGTAQGLHLYRLLLQSNIFPAVPTFWYIYKDWFVRLGPLPFNNRTDRRSIYYKRSGATTNTSLNTKYTLMLGANPSNNSYDAKVYDYKIFDKQFGTVLFNGIEYSWDRGANWP